MRRVLPVLLFLLLASPALGGSLEIKSTDRNGQTTTVVKKVYGPSQGPSRSDRTSAVRARDGGSRRTVSEQDSSTASPDPGDGRSDLLLSPAKAMLQELDETMDRAEEEFKKDAAGGQ